MRNRERSEKFGGTEKKKSGIFDEKITVCDILRTHDHVVVTTLLAQHAGQLVMVLSTILLHTLSTSEKVSVEEDCIFLPFLLLKELLSFLVVLFDCTDETVRVSTAEHTGTSNGFVEILHSVVDVDLS